MCALHCLLKVSLLLTVTHLLYFWKQETGTRYVRNELERRKSETEVVLYEGLILLHGYFLSVYWLIQVNFKIV